MTALLSLARHVFACTACPAMRYSHVLGAANGSPKARVMLVGEAPGRLGAGRSGVPFLGDESGRRFEALLALAGLRRDEVFVTNAVLCNPVDPRGRNRRPGAADVKRCLPFLKSQVEAVDPELVVALGGVALAALGRVEAHGLRLRRDCGGCVAWYGRRLLPLYHPGRRALVHRGEDAQRADWLRLRQLVPGPEAGQSAAATRNSMRRALSGAAGVRQTTW